MAMFNVYRWRGSNGPLQHAERVAQVDARHAPAAILIAAAGTDGVGFGMRLFARRADGDPYADDPSTTIAGHPQ